MDILLYRIISGGSWDVQTLHTPAVITVAKYEYHAVRFVLPLHAAPIALR
jgi:hypothetical protein